MNNPKRITRIPQEKIPEDSIFIGPRSSYANQFKVQKNYGGFYTIENKKLNWRGIVMHKSKEEAQKAATQLYAFFFHKKYKTEEEIQEFLAPLRGKDLCCWCKPDAPCHVDYLIYLLSGGKKHNDN